MKKLLIFSILFSIFSIGRLNVKAEANFYDEPLVIDKNIFDDKTYNLSDCSFRNGIGYYKFKSLYPEKYDSIVEFFEENDYKYIFGSDALIFWQGDDLQYLVYAYNSRVVGVLYNPSQIWVKVVYYNSSINGSNILDKVFTNTRDRFVNNYGGIMFHNIGSNSTLYGYDTKNPNASYGIVLDTNIDIRFDSDYRASLTTSTDKYYHSIVVGGKTYNSGDYITRKTVQHENPKITFKYLTDTGQEDGHKIGVTTTVDFLTEGVKNNRYSYSISFDGGKVWDDLTPRMTSDKYTFVKLENFNVIARLYDSGTGESYYSTGLVDSIENGYYSRWLSYQKNNEYDDYTVVDGINYLTSITINFYQEFNKLNGYPLQLYYSYDRDKWKEVPKMETFYLVFNLNTTIYFMYKDIAKQSVFYSTYTFNYFDSTESLGEMISFYEEEKLDGEYHVYVYFLNYKDIHSYWVKTVNEDYHEIDVRKMNGHFSWFTTEENTFCAKITQKGEPLKIIQEECYLSGGIRPSPDKSFKKILFDYSESIPNVMNVMSNFFDSLPSGIKNMFVAILLIILAIFIIKLLL